MVPRVPGRPVTLAVRAYDTLAGDTLAGGSGWRVHSTFAHAVNLVDADGGLLGIVAPPGWNGPATLLLADAPPVPLTILVRPGDTARLACEGLQIGAHLTLALSGAAVWRPTPIQRDAPPEMIRDRCDQAAALALGLVPAAGVGPLLSHLDALLGEDGPHPPPSGPHPPPRCAARISASPTSSPLRGSGGARPQAPCHPFGKLRAGSDQDDMGIQTHDTEPERSESPQDNRGPLPPRLLARAGGWEGAGAVLDPASPGADAPLLAIAGARIVSLIAAIRDANPVAVHAAARRLSGLGPGLTPSGDDVLAGLALGLAAGRGQAVRPAIAAALADAVVGRTTDLAVARVQHAAAGHADEAVHDLLGALVGGDGTGGAMAVRRLLSYGHASGADTLLGLLLGLRLGLEGAT